MEPITVLSLIELTEAHQAELRAVSPRLVIHVCADDPLPDAVRNQTEIVLGGGPLVQDVQSLPRLQWIQGTGAGVDRMLDQPIWQSHVQITTASGIHLTPIAERALAMMLAFRAQLIELWGYKQRKEWPVERWDLFAKPTLRGSILGIVGYGAIGGELGRQAHALGMRVLALNRSGQRRPMEGYLEAGLGDREAVIPEVIYGHQALYDLLPQCDHVVLLTPLTPATWHLFNAEAFAHMKSSAYFYNYGRGGLVDEPALINALQSGQIAGAGLDVFAQEPLPVDSPLWDMPNVIISPHIGGMTADYNDRVVKLFAENLRRYISGQPLFNLVDRTNGY